MNRPLTRRRNFQFQGRASVIVPDFGSIDAMPVRPFTARQQEVDRGRRSAPANSLCVPERLAEMAAFGMGLEVQELDNFRSQS